MELVLWRHADAEPGFPDLERRLTDKGRRQAARIAKWLHARMEGEWDVLSSPAARARETADALGRDYEVRLTLGPLATEDALLRESGWPDSDRSVIVVGHQPTLGRVAARLLAGRVGDLSIKKGSILWFSTRFDDEAREGATILRAVISPDFAE
jgi:phosphohistidine phosphatase